MCIGANYHKGGCAFTVWAPRYSEVSLLLTEENEKLTMEKTDEGYWKLYLKSLKPGTKYMYQLNPEKSHPDPASHHQPQGVFAPSAVVDHKKYKWTDEKWQGINQENIVMYELHVGTFTSEGTFNAIIDKINELTELGITAVELMPVTQFSGSRNWGYDPVFPYAVQNTYGGPEGLKELVNQCHMHGVAVFLDVIYNHLGPEGNCFHDYGPYFLEERRTPWGAGINFDGPDSLQVRKYFFENALYWFRNYHIDGLRLDAVHAIIDSSPKHFLKELSEIVNHYSKKKKEEIFSHCRKQPKRTPPRTVQKIRRLWIRCNVVGRFPSRITCNTDKRAYIILHRFRKLKRHCQSAPRRIRLLWTTLKILARPQRHNIKNNPPQQVCSLLTKS
jgi:maltooligosyltrehalose trehalohydrolase